jgi:ABC-2 type transport system permease protein
MTWAMRDAWTMTQRAFLHWIANPGPMLVGLLFPVLLLLMFAYLFGAGMTIPGGGDYVEFLVPGLLAVAVLFGVESTVLAVTTDAARGVTDRFRAIPMAPSAVVSGRAMADMAYALLGLAVLIGAGLAVGWRWHEGIGDALLALALLLLLRFALVWVGVYLGLLLETPEAAVSVQILVWPVAGLSSAFAAPENMPDWLGTIAEWSPISSTAAAIRELFGNPGWGGESWIAQHAELMAIAWPLAIVAVFFPLSVRRWRGLSR